MLVEKTTIKNLVVIRMNPGDDVLASLTEAVKANNIKNAVILTGVGSVQAYHYHVVASEENVPKTLSSRTNVFTKGEKYSDVVNLNGCVINGRVHAHIILSDKDIAYGGHLEPGTEVLTFLITILGEVDYDLRGFDTVGNIEEFRKEP